MSLISGGYWEKLEAFSLTQRNAAVPYSGKVFYISIHLVFLHLVLMHYFFPKQKWGHDVRCVIFWSSYELPDLFWSVPYMKTILFSLQKSQKWWGHLTHLKLLRFSLKSLFGIKASFFIYLLSIIIFEFLIFNDTKSLVLSNWWHFTAFLPCGRNSEFLYPHPPPPHSVSQYCEMCI